MAIHRYKAGSNEPDEVIDAPAPTPKSTDTQPVKKVKKSTKKDAKPKKEKKERTPKKITAPFRAIGRYFKGSWYELRQVHWPNRKQTWVLTFAVIIFSLALGILIFLLDLGFTYLFKEVVL